MPRICRARGLLLGSTWAGSWLPCALRLRQPLAARLLDHSGPPPAARRTVPSRWPTPANHNWLDRLPFGTPWRTLYALLRNAAIQFSYLRTQGHDFRDARSRRLALLTVRFFDSIN
jgi:hypothetical protein